MHKYANICIFINKSTDSIDKLIYKYIIFNKMNNSMEFNEYL